MWRMKCSWNGHANLIWTEHRTKYLLGLKSISLHSSFPEVIQTAQVAKKRIGDRFKAGVLEYLELCFEEAGLEPLVMDSDFRSVKSLTEGTFSHMFPPSAHMPRPPRPLSACSFFFLPLSAKNCLKQIWFCSSRGSFPRREKTNIVIMVITSICLARQTATGPFERASVLQRCNLILIHESSVMHISTN